MKETTFDSIYKQALVLALKITAKNGLDLENFHFSQKFGRKKYVAMAGMMIFVKHFFFNIPDVFFFIFALKKRLVLKNFHFS